MSFHNQICKVRWMRSDGLHKIIIISLLIWSNRSSSCTHTILYIYGICHILFHCVLGSLGNSQTLKSPGPWLSSPFINSSTKSAALMMLWQPDSWQVFSFISNAVINLLVHKYFTFSGGKKNHFPVSWIIKSNGIRVKLIYVQNVLGCIIFQKIEILKAAFCNHNETKWKINNNSNDAGTWFLPFPFLRQDCLWCFWPHGSPLSPHFTPRPEGRTFAEPSVRTVAGQRLIVFNPPRHYFHSYIVSLH